MTDYTPTDLPDLEATQSPTPPYTDNVVPLDIMTTVDIPPKRVIEAALECEFDNVIVIGSNEAEDNLYIASSTGSGPMILWMLEQAKKDILG